MIRKVEKSLKKVTSWMPVRCYGFLILFLTAYVK
jgi:hypothetical protein